MGSFELAVMLVGPGIGLAVVFAVLRHRAEDRREAQWLSSVSR